MNPYGHEFLSLLRRKAVIGIVIVAVLAGSISYVSIDSTTFVVLGSGYWYVENGVYHLDVWTVDVAGNALHRVKADLVVTEFPGNFSPPGMLPKTVFIDSATSDAGGMVGFVFTLPSAPNGTTFQASLSGSYPMVASTSFVGAFGGSFALQNLTAPDPQAINSPFNDVAQGYYDALDRYFVTWSGFGGTSPAGEVALACTIPFNPFGPFQLPSNCTGAVATQRLGTLTGFATFLPVPTLPTILANGTQLSMFLEIVNPSGQAVYISPQGTMCPSGPCIPDSGYVQGTPGPGLLQQNAVELSFLLPLLALLLVYWSYARPRLTGALEPVLARPLTRRGVFLTRYGVVALAFVVASMGQAFLLDIGLAGFLGEPLPGSMIPPLVGGYAVAAIGFAGIVFLSAHLFRSTGPVLGSGLALLFVFSTLWEEIAIGLGKVAGINVNSSAAFGRFYLWSQLASPAQIPGVTSGLLTHLGIFTRNGYATAGVGGWAIAAVSVGWIALPFLLTLWRVVTRD